MQNFQTSNSSEKPLAVVASSLGQDGYDLAKQFAENGYDIIVAASNPSIVEEAEDFKELGVDAVSFQLDLTTAEGVEQLYKRIIATGRPVEVMVVHSSIGTDKDLAKKVLKDMTLRGRGKIIFSDSEEVDEMLRDEARNSGVQLSVLKSSSRDIYFLKKGFEEPKLLH